MMEIGLTYQTGDNSSKRELGMKGIVLATGLFVFLLVGLRGITDVEYSDTFKLLRSPIFPSINKEIWPLPMNGFDTIRPAERMDIILTTVSTARLPFMAFSLGQ